MWKGLASLNNVKITGSDISLPACTWDLELAAEDSEEREWRGRRPGPEVAEAEVEEEVRLLRLEAVDPVEPRLLAAAGGRRARGPTSPANQR